MGTKWKKKFEHLSEKDWLEKIEKISDIGLRTKIAYIIWWDFFSEKEGGLGVFKQYISKRMREGGYSPKEFYEELSKIYPEKEAAERSGMAL